MFCPKCGAKNEDGAKFCGACGAPIPQPESTPAPGTQPAGAPAPGQVPGPVPGPAPTPSPISGGASQLGNLAGNLGGILPLARIIAGAVMIVCFFLPLYSLAGLISVSAMQMTFGIDFYGSHLDGSFENVLFLVAGILVLVAAFAVKGKPGDILTIVGGALSFILVIAVASAANDQMGGYLTVDYAIGAWLYILAGIACIAIGVLSMVGSKK